MEVKVIMHLNGDEGLVQFFYQFNKEINEILKSNGCKFDSRSRMWEIEIKPENGRPEDKITEIALALIAQGHEVEVKEDDMSILLKNRATFIKEMIANKYYVPQGGMAVVFKDRKLTVLNPTDELKKQLDELAPVVGAKSLYIEEEGNRIRLKSKCYKDNEASRLIKTLPLSYKVMEEFTISKNGEKEWEK